MLVLGFPSGQICARGNLKTFWILVLTTKKPTAFNNETQL